jgi:glutamyl-tRNA reductase
VGEPQILGQVKDAFAKAAELKHTGAVTNRLFNAAFTVGKRVRTETGLGEGAVSVSYAAIALAKKIFGALKGLDVLILGAGEMAELTGVHLKAQQVKQVTIASRTLATAESLARDLGGRAVPWASLGEALQAADIVISATGATNPVLTKVMIEATMRPRRSRPLFIIDIALPRDVEGEVGNLDQVFLYNIDDLQGIVQENLARRTAELERAGRIVTEEVDRFGTWMQAREIIPTVVALRQRFEAIRKSELTRLEPKLSGLPPEARARVDEITHLIVEKLLLTPTEQLKAVNDETMVVAYSDALNKLFSLAAEEKQGREQRNGEKVPS